MSNGHYGAGIAHRKTKHVIARSDKIIALNREIAQIDERIAKMMIEAKRRQGRMDWKVFNASNRERNALVRELSNLGWSVFYYDSR